MKTRLTEHSYIRISTVIFILVLFAISSRPAHSQYTPTTITPIPGAALVVGQPVSLSSLFAVQPATYPNELGAIVCFADIGFYLTVSGSACASLSGDPAACPAYSNLPQWTSVTLTATQPTDVGFLLKIADLVFSPNIYGICGSGSPFSFFNYPSPPVCSANCISLELVDYVDFVGVNTNGQATGGQSRHGVSADGVAQLLVRATTSRPGQVAFSLQGTSGYDLGSLSVSSAPTVAVGGTNKAFAIYQAPLDYTTTQGDSSGSRTVTLNAVFTPIGGGQTATQTQTITIVRPPVVLVHGLNSSYVQAWLINGFTAGLQSAMSGLNIQPADYVGTHAAAFSVNNNIPGAAIFSALRQYNAMGYAATQADVIGHSMGGLLTRIWTQNGTPYNNNRTFYRSRSNYYAGNVHKLITIDSPHLGSFWANYIGALTGNFTFTDLANKWGWSINSGAIEDLQTTSQAIATMNGDSHYSNTPASVVVGSDSNIVDCFNPLWGLMNLLGLSIPVLGAPNDTIVAVGSQAPPHSVPQGSTLPFCHTNITSKQEAVTEAVKRLNASAKDTSLFLPFTNGLGGVVQTNPIVAKKTPAAVAQSSSFSITSPSSGAVLAPGSQITVTTQASGGYSPTSIMIGTSEASVQIAAPNNSATITIPNDVAGALAILATAVDAGGVVQSTQVIVQVSPSATLNSIAVSPSFIQLSSQQSAQLSVIGYYSDNVARDITQLVSTSFRSFATTVAAVGQNGVVTGVGPGTASVLVSNSNQYAFAQINGEGTAAGARNTHDFNGDGYSDIAWTDGSGHVAFWLMNSATLVSSGVVGGVPSTWSIVGQRDFDGDGMADLLWHDTSGNSAIWFMNGASLSSAVSVGAIPTSWSVAGTGDFNGDGMGDILWRDSSGNLAVWLMNGATISSSATLGNVPTNWNVVGTGDFNGDGMTDLLWQDNLGNAAIWFMSGTTIASTGGLGNIPTNWSIVGTGDFNGDGMTDIVWRDTLGDTSIWFMNGATISSAGGIGTVPTTWSIALVGDFNGDGMSDLVWRDTSGNTAIWFMNGAAISSTAGVGNVPTNWTVQSVNAE
jgi:pimeloyl-ACP methyl ester carboxylesterase